MRKNPSPGNIAFFAAFISALIPTLLIWVLDKDIKWTLLVFAISILGAFITFYYLLQIFIYRKIKLIYKNIYRFKSQDKKIPHLFSANSQDPIGEVSNEVLNWMRDNQREITQLKEQAGFRREFLSNVSHELKTPVFSIQGYIHTLLDGALEDPKVNRKFLKIASKNADRMVEMVEELTAISAFESGNIELDIQRFDIWELIKEVYEMLEDQARDKDVTLDFKKRSNKSFWVKADKKRISQVATNLIVNAIKYGKKKGRVSCAFYDMDQHILVEISDEGEGIEAEHLPRLFERFYRIDRHRSRDEGGSGLGLAIVKHIIEAHKQTINVSSTKGEGTTFGFTLMKA